MKYCAYCGKQIEDDAICECQSTPKESNANIRELAKKVNIPRNPQKLIIPTVLVAAVVVLLFGILAFGSSTIDLKDYIVVEGVTGLNGQGTVNVSLDEDALYAIIVGENQNSVDFEDMSEDELTTVMTASVILLEEYGNALDCITLSTSPDSGLSTGDKVTVTATFVNSENYDFNYRFKNGSVTYTVPELSEGETFDPFAEDAVSMQITGFSGTATAYFEKLTNEGPYAYIYYDIDVAENLSEGDIVTVTANYNAGKLDENEFRIPDVSEKKYIVEGLNRYFTLDDGLPEELLEMMKEVAVRGAYDVFDEDNKIVRKPVVEGVYFIKMMDDSQTDMDYTTNMILNNAVFVVCSYTEMLLGDEYLFHSAYLFPNFGVDDNGLVNYDSANSKYIGFGRSTLEEFEEWLSNEYSDEMAITKIE